ncbi:hypothetical protein G9A89_012906 [Geosiphon pyriformis]|nr:hypothetical protein G9A89_012906 [Geosiphon pyriformis]
MKCWSSVDNVKSSVVQNLVNSGAGSNYICSVLFGAKKSYHASKLTESLRAKKANIRSAIDKKMESFKVNKGHTIKSVLEHPFRKMVLNYLIVNDDLILKPDLVKSKGTTTQSPIFAIGSVVENALEKNQELWLVLQDMQKAYDLVDWKHLKNNFGLTDGYCVHNVKCQESVCEYRLNSYFISKNGHAKSWAGHSSFFAAGAFIDNTIWIGSSQSTTQHIFNVASEFFRINDISINNDKTVTISINSRVNDPSFSISGLPISITKKGDLIRVHSNICFFTNLVLKKAVSDKQFLYLVSAVFYPIVSYRTQFSFVSVGVCNKWNALICKGLKLKSGLLLNFPSNTIHHPSFYDLKSFSQFNLRSVHPLVSSAHICVNVSNNFLAGIVYILFDCKLSLASFLASSFWFYGGVPMSVWKRLDPHSLVPKWFELSVVFFVASRFSPLALADVGFLDICGSNDFVSVCDCLSWIGADSLSVYTNGSLKNLGMINCRAEAAAFFEDINLGLGVGVQDLVLSILMELQAIVLALKCMPAAHFVHLFLDNQVALDAYRSESDLVCPDFCNQYWVKHQHIRNVIHSKNLRVKWHKIKGHSGILGNNCANSIANAASLSGWYLLPYVSEYFLLADGGVVFSNSRHFVCDVFHAVCCAHWEVGFGSGFLDGDLCSDVNWLCSSRTLHCWLPMAVRKRIYDKYYPSVLCLYCGEMKVSNHVFFCVVDDSACYQVLESSAVNLCFGLSGSSTLYKGFVFNEWLREAISVFHDPKVAGVKIADFVRSICLAFRNDIWLVCAKHHAFMKKNGLIPVDGLISISVSGLVLAFGIHFGFCKSCAFFSGIDDLVSVNINA